MLPGCPRKYNFYGRSARERDPRIRSRAMSMLVLQLREREVLNCDCMAVSEVGIASIVLDATPTLLPHDTKFCTLECD